jgi:type I restriction enzyme R subunit
MGCRSRGKPYGRPEDYLDSFKRFIETNLNQMPALMVVTQRPRDLTRAQLKELKAALDAAGYGEATLRSAWRDATNADIAASIIGYVRQAALGDALVPYGSRVDRAIAQILQRSAVDGTATEVVGAHWAAAQAGDGGGSKPR